MSEYIELQDHKRWVKDQFNTADNSLLTDLLPSAVRTPEAVKKVGRAVKGAFSSLKKGLSSFGENHPDGARVLGTVVLLVVIVGATTLISHPPQWIGHAWDWLSHSPMAEFGKKTFLWGKGLAEQLWQTAPEMGGIAFATGALLLLTAPGKSLWSANDWAMFSIGALVTGYGVAAAFTG